MSLFGPCGPLRLLLLVPNFFHHHRRRRHHHLLLISFLSSVHTTRLNLNQNPSCYRNHLDYQDAMSSSSSEELLFGGRK